MSDLSARSARSARSALGAVRVVARVTTAAEAAARDQAAIAAGTPSFELMLRAGTAAAALVLRDLGDHLAHGVALFAGGGNNGGDAYVVAAQLARAGVVVRVHVAAPPRTPDAQRASRIADRFLRHGPPTGHERVVVDGVLGTGHRGALRNGVATACAMLAAARDGGARVLALDVPSGLDATTGAMADGSVPAHVTLCFGSIKRGVLLQRAHAGRILAIDIGLDVAHQVDDRAWQLASVARVARALPPVPWNAHKGTRGHLALVGGATGMAGALVLATRAALASGCGLAKVWISESGLSVMQQSAPQAIAHPWPAHDSNGDAWGHALAIGPGLGRSADSQALLRRALRENPRVPLLLDADALTLTALHAAGADAAAVIRDWCGPRAQMVCTPHPGEFARLLGAPVPRDWEAKAQALSDFATASGSAVLLKGTPTLIATPGGEPPTVVAHGTSLLATGGSGDLLTGIIGALLASGVDAGNAAMLGATAHGIAAELATSRAGGVRGLTLEAVLDALPYAWRRMARPATFHPDVLSEFPSPTD